MSEYIVTGGDGFCGWATSLALSDQGHDVTIVDNLSHRDLIDKELGVESLTPIASIEDRLATWKRVTGREIGFENINIATFDPDSTKDSEHKRLVGLIRDKQPDAIIHFAEQRAAPYSMKSPWHRRFTVNNNVNATNNILAALVETGVDAHVVHLGTMGVYGYGAAGKTEIPEGYLKVKIDTPDGEVEQEILYPASPGSIYHNTKVMDQSMLAFAAKNDEIRATDLHQGIVWGTQTAQTRKHEALINRFDYDSDFGTVLNRFIVEAAIGHPLTVYGSGGQTRAFIHIDDTVRCIKMALDNPPERGEKPKIFNQMAGTHRLIDLAHIISDISGVKIDFLDNPRKEADSNELVVNNDTLAALGLTDISDKLLEETELIAKAYKDRVDVTKIPPISYWRQPVKA